jgi:hypothetical protein
MRVPSLPRFIVAASAIALITSPAVAQRGGGRGGAGGATAVQPPRFEYVGPDNGGRIASVAGIPGDTMTYYFGAASGGVWKTTDGAHTFAPVFDDQSSQAIGALAVAPSSPRTVWAGTGEAWAIRDADVMGDGIYKSTDAGATADALAKSSSIRPTPTSSTSAHSAAPPGRSRNAVCIARKMAVRTGNASSS